MFHAVEGVSKGGHRLTSNEHGVPCVRPGKDLRGYCRDGFGVGDRKIVEHLGGVGEVEETVRGDGGAFDEFGALSLCGSDGQ